LASPKTKLTELGTAVGLVHEASEGWPGRLDRLRIPGIDDEVWKPVVLPAATGGPSRHLLLAAVANGRFFRQHVLHGRRPHLVEWTGGSPSVWTSDVPRDLTVEDVWFLQTKFSSDCLLNTAPAVLVDGLLVDDEDRHRPSWFEEVAQRELEAYYGAVRGHAPLLDLPARQAELTAEGRAALKAWMRARSPAEVPTAERDAYHLLCRAVSIETVLRWRLRLRAATVPQRTQMLFRMLRIAGGPYWLLGTAGSRPVRLRVLDTRTWRQRFDLRDFTVLDGRTGQPQVDWRATVRERATREDTTVEGFCEIRWSHGKLQGNPECKVQVVTPLAEIPGYEPVA
jgi:hypothetical protein